ncbi:MAG: MFS transporter [Micrococcales bacterium]|nr:MFS transporter [Micrococcales bacterium]
MAETHSPEPRALARYALLAATVIGTMSNNIINVPLRSIAQDYGQTVQRTVLAVLAFSLFLAVTMPLTGWLGDRFGRRRVLAAAVGLMALTQVAAALAPNLELLVASRGAQGLACSGIPPLVMGILIWMHPAQPARMMAAWAAANGIGQAAGPPIGGVVADWFGWRAIFVVMAVATLTVLAALLLAVPADRPRPSALHLPGAILLTSGAGLLLAGISSLSQSPVPRLLSWTLIGVGLVVLLGFLLVSRGNASALIPVRFIAETRFARSTVAAFAQMFALGTALVAIPLVLTGAAGLSTSTAGAAFFVLPLTMAVLATFVGRLSERHGPRRVLRTGLVVIVVGACAIGLVAGSEHPRVPLLVPLLSLLGLGMAFVQTPAATGATRSPAGSYGAALGLFSLVRFAGSTTGAAWVALLVPRDATTAIFAGVAVISVLALALSFAGPDPVPVARG